jgi:hypothetical protein
MPYERDPTTVTTFTLQIAKPMDVRRTLASAGLAECQEPLAAELANYLDINLTPITVNGILATRWAREGLAGHTDATARDFTAAYREHVLTDYSQAIDSEIEQPMSPRRFARDRNLNSHQNAFRDAYASEVHQSKTGLLDVIEFDENVPEGVVEDERLRHAVVTRVTNLHDEIQAKTTEVQELLLVARTKKQGGFAIRKSKRVTSVQTTEQSTQLRNSLDSLHTLLSTARQATRTIADLAASEFYEEVDGFVAGSLQESYDGLVMSALELLGVNLIDAYEAIAERESSTTRETKQVMSPDTVFVPVSAQTVESGSRREDNNTEPAAREVNLGELQNEFPWLEDGVIDFSFVNGERPFLFTYAPTRKFRDISDHLRRQPENIDRFTTLLD